MHVRIICPYKIPPPLADNQISALSDSDRPSPEHSEAFDIIEGEYIVIFKNQFDSVFSDQVARRVSEVRQELQNKYLISDQSIISQWQRAIQGFAAKLDSNQVQKLKTDPDVARITPNIYGRIDIRNSTEVELIINRNLNKNLEMGGQILPWGVERLRGPYNGNGKTAWIMDTGIDLDHPDLNVDVSKSVSFISGEDANDLNGHGTHVAGIIGAIDNDIGVVGMAEDANVIAVKVCNQFGDCPKSSFLDGIEHIIENASSFDVVNVSLG